MTAEAPASVPAGGTFTVKLTADPINVPTDGGGYPIRRLTDLKVRFRIPSGSTFVSATQAGGSNLGTGARSVTVSGNVLTLNVPGPLAPGTTAVLPTLTVNLKATGAVGTSLPAQLSGTSHDDPAITFTAVVFAVFFEISAPTNCYAPTNPVLATTTIS